MNRIEPSIETDRIAHAVIGAAIEVHRILGPGYLESVYEEALVLELRARDIQTQRQVAFPIEYKGQLLASGQIDLLIERVLLVEIKAVQQLVAIHHAQVIAYLRASKLQLGLLINFNVPQLRMGLRRVIWNDPTPTEDEF